MKKEPLDELFASLDFDVAEPTSGHRDRFEEKLRESKRRKIKRSKIFPLWAPLLAVAASILVAVLLFPAALGLGNANRGELASVSPEMAETQNFYSSVITRELASLEREKNPETEAVVADALKQLSLLEQDYEKLKNDLVESGQDNRVIYAMITNFQKRIDLLNQVLEKINTIKTLKAIPNENHIL